MERQDLSLHNVAELRPGGDVDPDLAGGEHLQRLPESVREALNWAAQERYQHPAGVEVRVVQTGDEAIEVTLSASARSPVEVFWGPFQERRVEIGPGRSTLALDQPDPVADLRPEVAADQAFSPDVCRIRFAGAHRGGVVGLHGASGPRRPPDDDEVPDRTLLAYGTSITEGEAPSAEHLAYVSQTARRLDADLRNLGTCGSAYCEPEVTDYLAEQSFDVGVLALSVNMIDSFEVSEFRERAAYAVETVAAAHPETPVAAVTLYPYYDDLLVDGDDQRSAAFRETLREVVAEADRPNLHLLEGPDLLDPSGLRADVLHPGDAGMVQMGERLAAALADLE
ncbi:MAG: SGNH/GDSL hydrolase family protein [Halobacteriaceae archaeon]